MTSTKYSFFGSGHKLLPSFETHHIYRDILFAINIEGFEAYRCISDAYRGPEKNEYNRHNHFAFVVIGGWLYGMEYGWSMKK